MLICIKIYHKYFWWQLVHFSFVHVTLRFLTEKDKQIRWIIILDFIIFLLPKKKNHIFLLCFLFTFFLFFHTNWNIFWLYLIFWKVELISIYNFKFFSEFQRNEFNAQFRSRFTSWPRWTSAGTTSTSGSSGFPYTSPYDATSSSSYANAPPNDV